MKGMYTTQSGKPTPPLNGDLFKIDVLMRSGWEIGMDRHCRLILIPIVPFSSKHNQVLFTLIKAANKCILFSNPDGSNVLVKKDVSLNTWGYF